MSETHIVSASKIYQAYRKSREIVINTVCEKSLYLSEKYGAEIFLKREDLQCVRSFKIRGAANAFRGLSEEERKRGVVTASAGNHAQGIAYCCKRFKTKGTIFMPSITPKLKINSVRHHGGEWLDIRLIGLTFDDAVAEARKFEEENNSVFIHAFDNYNVIEGQGGLAVEILENWSSNKAIDYVFTCVGGGGLAAGITSYFSQMAPQTTVVGFQPKGSPSMYNSLMQGSPVILESLQTFVDGASMKRTGNIPFEILKELKFKLHLVDEGKVASTMLQMYNNEAIILQPAGALGVAGLQLLKNQIQNKTIVCIISGSNNDISRLPQVRLRSMIYEVKEAYYMISASIQINVRLFISSIIDPQTEDIIFMNTAKRFNSSGQCLLGLAFSTPQAKPLFQKKVLELHYKLVQLKANDPLLKILL